MRFTKFYNSVLVLGVTALSLLAVSQTTQGRVITGTDDVAQLPFWEWRTDTISIRLVQRLPDQSRAYFTARGFSKENAELIANNCVFQTIFKNEAKAGSSDLIEYDLSTWVIEVNGQSHSLRLREEWGELWQKQKVSPKATIAFNWSLLPTQQKYKAQDYNWGMTLYGLPPGTRFDLKIVWKENGKSESGIIEKLECAPDLQLDPKEPFG